MTKTTVQSTEGNQLVFQIRSESHHTCYMCVMNTASHHIVCACVPVRCKLHSVRAKFAYLKYMEAICLIAIRVQNQPEGRANGSLSKAQYLVRTSRVLHNAHAW